MRRAFILLLFACGCGGSRGTSPHGASIDGPWEGVFYEPSTTVHGTAALTVAGTVVSGSTSNGGSFSLALVGENGTGTANLPNIGSGAVTAKVYPETPEALRLVVIVWTTNGRVTSMSLKRPGGP